MMIPPPNDWKEFENIVKSALELRWRTSDLTIHGRQGQKQNGVDIYGSNDLGCLVGIQCKLTVNSISKSIINEETSNAEHFQPSISTLYIATTSPSDVALQQHVRNLSATRAASGQFPVGILFWMDIVQDLTKDTNAVQRHYPQLFKIQNSNQYDSIDLRRRDIENLRDLLGYIDIEVIPCYIEMAPKSVHIDFLCGSDTFEPIRTNPSFNIYDEQLSIILHSWLDKWHEIIAVSRLTYEFQENTNRLIFPMPMDAFRTHDESIIYDHLVNLYHEYHTLLKNFTQFIHQEYPEVNLKETSAKARKWQAQFQVGEI
jgi:hypothetical protein